MKKNLRTLEKDVKERFPEFKSLKIFAWCSFLYSPPILQFNNLPYKVTEKYQGEPYTPLHHVSFVRNIVMNKEVDKKSLAYYFIENTLEKALREKIPDSVERFRKCVELSRLSFDEIKKFSEKVKERESREVILESLLIGV